MIEFLLLDLDDTILDFKMAEYIAIGKTIQEFGVEPTAEVRQRYHEINDWHWKQLELGNLTRRQVQVERFTMLFRELGREVDAEYCAQKYMENLSMGHYFLPGAEEAVMELSKKYRLFLVSNGNSPVQKGRLTSANLYRFFEAVFISQDIGHNKPSRAYFDACFARIPGFDPDKALMVGDSLSSDILGGINAGIKTVWVNPSHKPCGDIRPDYEIEALHQLPALLETM